MSCRRESLPLGERGDDRRGQGVAVERGGVFAAEGPQFGGGQVADYLGVVPRTVVPPPAATAILLTVLAAGAVVGLVVGLRNRRTSPAQLLRAE